MEYVGEQTIIKQGGEVDKVIFVKEGFCKVIREVHPDFHPRFEAYADHRKPPPNPLLPAEPAHKEKAVEKEKVEGENVNDSDVSAKQLLHKLMRQFNEGDEAAGKSAGVPLSARKTDRTRKRVAGKPYGAPYQAQGMWGKCRT